MSDDSSLVDELRFRGNDNPAFGLAPAYEVGARFWFNRAAARIESLQAELAEVRAVIEQVGAEATRHSEVVDGCVRVETAYVTQVLSAYRAAPSSALDAARIEAWERGRDDERQAALDKRFPDCPYRSES